MSEPKDYWLDHSENVTKLFKGLWAVGLALLSIDLLLHRHEEFGFSTWFGFYGIFGFFACVGAGTCRKETARRSDASRGLL